MTLDELARELAYHVASTENAVCTENALIERALLGKTYTTEATVRAAIVVAVSKELLYYRDFVGPSPDGSPWLSVHDPSTTFFSFA